MHHPSETVVSILLLKLLDKMGPNIHYYTPAAPFVNKKRGDEHPLCYVFFLENLVEGFGKFTVGVTG